MRHRAPISVDKFEKCLLPNPWQSIELVSRELWHNGVLLTFLSTCKVNNKRKFTLFYIPVNGIYFDFADDIHVYFCCGWDCHVCFLLKVWEDWPQVQTELQVWYSNRLLNSYVHLLDILRFIIFSESNIFFVYKKSKSLFFTS